MTTHLLYITFPSKEEARDLAVVLLEERLAACVNIFDGVESLYYWNAKLQEDEEVVMIAKTVPAKSYQLIERVKELHSYDVPCIEVLEVKGGNEEFLQWIAEEVE